MPPLIMPATKEPWRERAGGSRRSWPRYINLGRRGETSKLRRPAGFKGPHRTHTFPRGGHYLGSCLAATRSQTWTLLLLHWMATSFGTRPDNFVAEKHQTLLYLQGILTKREDGTNRQRLRHNAVIVRRYSGECAQGGDLMLVKEADSNMVRKGTHLIIAYEHWTGRWQVTTTKQPAISYQVTMRGRRMTAANIALFHVRPEHLRHVFEDEFAHLVWGADLELADVSTMAVLLYTRTHQTSVGSTRNG